MPAVHHKLLLEDALQDSPQVGLRLFSHVCVPSCLIKGVTSAEVSLAQTVSSTRCSLFPLVDDSSQLTHCYKNYNPPVSSSCTFQAFLQHVTVICFFLCLCCIYKATALLRDSISLPEMIYLLCI